MILSDAILVLRTTVLFCHYNNNTLYNQLNSILHSMGYYSKWEANTKYGTIRIVSGSEFNYKDFIYVIKYDTK